MTNLLDQAISRDDGDYAGRARCFDRSDPLADSTTLTASCYWRSSEDWRNLRGS